VPHSHQALIETLRGDGRDWTGKVGTYDIEKSGAGYNYAVFDARQSAIHGRLIESFGRIAVRTYCCSQDMVDAVARGEILLAYNVQMSYGHAAQRAGQPIGVILPADYQAVQTRSVMLTRNGRNREDAIAFVDSLVAPAGQQLARALLQPLDASGAMLSNRMLAEVAVGPALLSLRDDARRARFIKEWTLAVKTPPPESAGD
jgi:iron(III) transport system substrate-binding protein